MSELVRISISIEDSLFQKLESMVEKNGYENRSEFIRDIIRDRLVEDSWNSELTVVGTLTLIYDHAKRELGKKLTDIQHSNHDIVLASTHVHLSHDICAEMIMLKGKSKEIKEMALNLGKQIGVLHSGLAMGTTGMEFES